MLGLKQFSAPQFYVPQIPQTERPLHKAKDMMSFLNSLQWKADEEEPADGWGEQTRGVKFDMNEGTDDRRGAEAAAAGLDASLNSGHDVSRRVGSTRWDGMDGSQLWEQAMDSIVTGENPTTKGYGDKIGMTPNDAVFGWNENWDKLPGKSRFAGWTPDQLHDYVNSPIGGI